MSTSCSAQRGVRDEVGKGEMMILKHPSERCTHVVRGLRWMDVKIKIKTTTYQFWALLCRCHSCEARQRNRRKKKEKEKNVTKGVRTFISH